VSFLDIEERQPERARGRPRRHSTAARPWTVLLRVGDDRHDRIVRNSLLLMIASGLMGVFGFLFWLVVARLYSPAQVGAASSLISAVNLIAYLSLAGLDVTVVRFMAKMPNPAELVTACVGIVTVTAAVISAAYVKYVPLYAPELAFVSGSIWLAAGFCIICVFASLNLFTDSVFLAARRPEFNLWADGIIQGVFKVASPFVLLSLGAYGILSATGVGYAMATIASLFFMRRALSLRCTWPRNQAVYRRLRGFSLSAYVANVLNIAPLLLLPLIALHSLGEAQAGFYFIAFQIANLVNAISYGIAEATFSEGSHNDANVMALVRKSARMLAMMLIPTVAVLTIGSRWVLQVIGAEYAQQGSDVLRLLLLGCLAVGLSAMSTQLLRLGGLMMCWIGANAVACVVTLGFAQVFALRGLMWLAWAWILGHLCAAAVGLLLFVLRRTRLVHVNPATPVDATLVPQLTPHTREIEIDAQSPTEYRQGADKQ
jgi:O-antigen/teichoic acid export membrane protein